MATWYGYEVLTENIANMGAYADFDEAAEAFRREANNTERIEEMTFGTIEADNVNEALNAVRLGEWLDKEVAEETLGWVPRGGYKTS